MGTAVGTDAAVTHLHAKEDETEECYEPPEHLPPLLEDEENVSLADVLSLRDTCLTEEEVWAIFAECVLAVKSIGASQLFHTLCITPDTLAFNAHGNVCFMEQLSDDPEGSFVPPEFDSTGSTFEGHMYSLGCTLSAALDFVIEPELQAELGEEAQRLLEQMQLENPEDRPLPQDVLSMAEARLSHTSSVSVCRKLSSLGRRVLSLESVANFQDGKEVSWEARWQHPKTRYPLNRMTSADSAGDPAVDNAANANGLSRQHICGAWDSSLWAEDMDGGEGDATVLGDERDCRSQTSSPLRRRAEQRLARARGVLNRSCSVPDSNNPPPASPAPHGDISVHVTDLTEIGADECSACKSAAWDESLRRFTRGLSCDSYDSGRTADCLSVLLDTDTWRGKEDAQEQESGCRGEPETRRCSESEERSASDSASASPCTSCRDQEVEQDCADDQGSLNSSLCSLNNHMTKSMLCLNEESQDEWISLRELLVLSGRRLTVNELWALCYTCLATLQTYIDFPTYLCLDTVYVGCEGEVLFLKPKNIGSCDAFYLAPEYQEHGILTEKACVYAVAAILWATAKFSLAPHQKLAMPRKLKRLLLEMAKRTPIERPSIAMAKKICRDYLSRQGTNAETVWSKLINRVHQPLSRCTDVAEENGLDIEQRPYEESTHINGGVMPKATESRLAPMPGPIPHSYAVRKELTLPEAFTSIATHFTPIILTREEDSGEGTPLSEAAVEGAVYGLARSSGSQHMQLTGLHFTAHFEDATLTQTDSDLRAVRLDLPSNHRAASTSTSTSSDRTLVNSPLTSPDEAKQGLRVSHPPLSSAPLNGCSLVNNYLLRQDPATGHLTLVPVQITTPESIPGLELNLPLITNSVQGCTTHTGGNNGLSVDCLSVSLSPTQQLLRSPPYFANGSSITHNGNPEHAVHIAHNGGGDPREAGKDASSSERHRTNVHPALQEVIDLLRGEFAFDGYLEDGAEDLAMGEYIFSLKDLQYQTFASVVKERFSGLYWEEDLLGVLHCLVNYSPSTLGSNEQPPSKDLQRAATAAPSTATIWTGSNKVHLHGCLDLNGNIHVASPTVAEIARKRTESQPGLGKSEPLCRNSEERSEENLPHVCPGVRAASGDVSGSGGIMEGGDRPAGADDESPSEADSLLGREGGHDDGQLSPECSEDMEDSDSLVSERLLSPGSRSEESSMSFSPRWALAFYGEDCFSQEVIQYALNLGQHSETPCLDLKMQELQQQLTIETRNLRKTRNFYQKLIQQDRKNKGSESKLMSSKLKPQLEELISRVDFLVSVKKYLEMMTVEQWGLEVSQLSSLAACGPGFVELRSSEDPALLSFGTSKGKSTLQAGSPLGLMSYLYARNAALEGYVQHFLYTYRHFCTPEELLRFLMDRFISSSRAGPDLSGDNARVFHRSLALLEAWVMDCRLVDFTQQSGLLTTLENFLITQVAPLDSRGEVLLTSLHSSPSKTLSHGSESLTSPDEGDDSLSVQLLCGKSSIEDPGRKTFQWRISRVVEPAVSLSKEKAFSIAAALPMPYYGSLMDDLSSGCLRGDERLPFSQSEYSAQQTAQQLTLLQQDIFQGCHPVHFLNSRSQGVKEKVLSPNKNVSQRIRPPEGTSLFVCEGTGGDSHLQRLLTYADSVTNWISAEIVICDTVKTQVALLSKFLLIGKHCYESRNFATAMQILRGLENVIVRQLPAWKHLPGKVCEILEELRAVQVFLKSDDLCLMGGEQVRRRPTLPSAHILAMHIQQLEIGAFTLTTGAYKWTKLRSIAKVVSQVHAFQETAYPYSPDRELQAYLRHRISNLSTCDVHLLAADNDANFQQSTERHTRRIQDTLRRVKATFQ